jgi:uncharacterized protein (PEP-CTERM system associated)
MRQPPLPAPSTKLLRRTVTGVGGGAGALALAALLSPAAALAQQGPGLVFSASIGGGLSAVHTRRDNGGTGEEIVLHARPGLRFASQTGRLRGSVSYDADVQQRFGENPYASGDRSNGDVIHNLSAALTAELVENFAFVEGTASVARRTLSPFGLQTQAASSADNANAADNARVSIRPYVRGVLGGAVNYRVGAHASTSRTRQYERGDYDETGASVSLGSASPGRIGWGLDASRQRVSFEGGRSTVNDRVTASLLFRPDVDWQFSLRGGQETSDVGSFDKRRYDNWGAGVRWQPGPRTLLAADIDRRYFGDGWNIVAEHRLARSSFRFTSSRDVSSSAGGVDQAISLYQIFFFQFASIQPDPVLRDLLVRDFLRTNNLDPNLTVPGGFLARGSSLVRRNEFAWTFSGQRLSWAVQAFSAATRTVDPGAAAQVPGEGSVEQKGLVGTASWRLTPTAAVSLSVSHLRTEDNGVLGGNTLHSASLALSEQLGARTAGSVSARVAAQRGGPDPYREASVTASVTHRF